MMSSEDAAGRQWWGERRCWGGTGMMAGGESVTMHHTHHDKQRGIWGHPPKHNNQIMIALLSTYYAIPFEMPSFKKVALTEEELDRYLGQFASDELAMTIKVTRKADKLFALATGQGEFPLEATKTDTFEFLAAGIKIKFDLPNNQMTLVQAGKSYIFRQV